MEQNVIRQENVKQYVQPGELFPAIQEMLDMGFEVEFTVTGNSMWPLLRHGRDTVILKSRKSKKLKVGDIVLMKVGEGRYLLHRITSVRDNAIQTTGDGNCFRDGWFSQDCVIGYAVRVKRKGEELFLDERKWRISAAIWRILFPFRKQIFKSWNLYKRIACRVEEA